MTAPKTEHCIDWRKTAAEIDAEFTALAQECDRLRNALSTERERFADIVLNAATHGCCCSDAEALAAVIFRA